VSEASSKHPQVGQNVPGMARHSRHGSLQSYLIGFGMAWLLTLAAFGLVWVPPTAMTPVSTEAGICVLAIAQMLVHIIFFMHINTSPESGTNITALILAIVIVALVVVGSMWIMGHLSDHMAPMPELMQMQR
jgi:cytochrome o ubiquinol oxidase subunit IV